MNLFQRIIKRIFDVFCSLLGMLLLSPLFLYIYIRLRLQGDGPVMFKQERIGYKGEPFMILKYRTMRVGADENEEPNLACRDDERLTPFGRFLRERHLDELPQLWNVFCGDMSFVGPRPERKFFIDQIMEYDKRYTYLYQIRPGVTSYATLYNGYTDTMEKMLKRLEYDLFYLRKRSWWFDIKILVKTFLSIIFGKKF